eukprot:16171446-Heterocapsa_arctica.AAC.1
MLSPIVSMSSVLSGVPAASSPEHAAIPPPSQTLHLGAASSQFSSALWGSGSVSLAQPERSVGPTQQIS